MTIFFIVGPLFCAARSFCRRPSLPWAAHPMHAPPSARMFPVRGVYFLIFDVTRNLDDLDAVPSVHFADRRAIVDCENDTPGRQRAQKILFCDEVLAII